jgi:predicted nuclease with TOPRIM domain
MREIVFEVERLQAEMSETKDDLERYRDRLCDVENRLTDRENELYKLRDEVESLRHVLACQKTYKVAREKFNTHRASTRQVITPDDPYLVAFLKADEALKAALLTVGETPEEG